MQDHRSETIPGSDWPQKPKVHQVWSIPSPEFKVSMVKRLSKSRFKHPGPQNPGWSPAFRSPKQVWLWLRWIRLDEGLAPPIHLPIHTHSRACGGLLPCSRGPRWGSKGILSPVLQTEHKGQEDM